jgi:hypothetical protein
MMLISLSKEDCISPEALATPQATVVHHYRGFIRSPSITKKLT